jgi:hypothetical protein
MIHDMLKSEGLPDWEEGDKDPEPKGPPKGSEEAQKTVGGKKLTGAEIDALDWLGDEMAKRGISEDEFYMEAE